MSAHDDINDLVAGYNCGCREVFDLHAPPTTRSRTVCRKPRWFNETVEAARRARRRSERKWRKSHTENDHLTYIKSQREVSVAITEAKTNYYNAQLSDCNYKDMFKVVNTLLNNNKCHLPDSTSPVNLANEFQDFFVNKVDNIRSEVDSINSGNCLPTDNKPLNCNMCSFDLVTVEELTRIINQCSSKSCDLDPMPTWLVKQHLPALIQILCRIVNCSLSSGVFPAELRKARITPVLKKPSLDTQQLTSYRPVSNLPFLGKLIEKVVSSQVASFVKSNDLTCLSLCSLPTVLAIALKQHFLQFKMLFSELLLYTRPFFSKW